MTRKSVVQAIVATLVCLVPLGWLGLSNEHAFSTGQVFLIETMGFDPRDPMRGDYVQYRFPELQLRDGSSDLARRWGLKTYVTLEPNEQGVLIQKNYSDIRPEAGQVFVSGINRMSRLVVAAEKYFVTEGPGLELEQLDRPFARVSISRDGRMNILDIIPREDVLGER